LEFWDVFPSLALLSALLSMESVAGLASSPRSSRVLRGMISFDFFLLLPFLEAFLPRWVRTEDPSWGLREEGLFSSTSFLLDCDSEAVLPREEELRWSPPEAQRRILLTPEVHFLDPLRVMSLLRLFSPLPSDRVLLTVDSVFPLLTGVVGPLEERTSESRGARLSISSDVRNWLLPLDLLDRGCSSWLKGCSSSTAVDVGIFFLGPFFRCDSREEGSTAEDRGRLSCRSFFSLLSLSLAGETGISFRVFIKIWTTLNSNHEVDSRTGDDDSTIGSQSPESLLLVDSSSSPLSLRDFFPPIVMLFG
jgi:hypothetical protein